MPSPFPHHACIKRWGVKERQKRVREKRQHWFWLYRFTKPVFLQKSGTELLTSSFNFDAFLLLEKQKFLSEEALHNLLNTCRSAAAASPPLSASAHTETNKHTHTHARLSVFHLLALLPSSLACVGVCVCVYWKKYKIAREKEREN